MYVWFVRSLPLDVEPLEAPQQVRHPLPLEVEPLDVLQHMKAVDAASPMGQRFNGGKVKMPLETQVMFKDFHDDNKDVST